MAAHAVGDGKEAELRVRDELILVRLANPACIRYATGPDHERISRRVEYRRKWIIRAYKSLEKEHNTTLVALPESAIPERISIAFAALSWVADWFIGVQGSGPLTTAV
jgi:hypothetical protein